MSSIREVLYRTNKSIRNACEELGVEYTEEILEEVSDMAQCQHCNVWFRAEELVYDRDGNEVCRFCHEWYQYG